MYDRRMAVTARAAPRGQSETPGGSETPGLEVSLVATIGPLLRHLQAPQNPRR